MFELLLKALLWIYHNWSWSPCRKHVFYQLFVAFNKISLPDIFGSKKKIPFTSLFLIVSRFPPDGSPSFRIGLAHLSTFHLSLFAMLTWMSFNHKQADWWHMLRVSSDHQLPPISAETPLEKRFNLNRTTALLLKTSFYTNRS